MGKEEIINKLSYEERYEREKIMANCWFIMALAFLFVLLGSVMNFTAIESNDCKMPIYREVINSYSSDKYVGFWDKSDVDYFFLTDRFKVGEKLYSLGDLVIYIGIGCMLLSVYLNFKLHGRIRKYENKKHI